MANKKEQPELSTHELLVWPEKIELNDIRRISMKTFLQPVVGISKLSVTTNGLIGVEKNSRFNLYAFSKKENTDKLVIVGDVCIYDELKQNQLLACPKETVVELANYFDYYIIQLGDYGVAIVNRNNGDVAVYARTTKIFYIGIPLMRKSDYEKISIRARIDNDVSDVQTEFGKIKGWPTVKEDIDEISNIFFDTFIEQPWSNLHAFQKLISDDNAKFEIPYTDDGKINYRFLLKILESYALIPLKYRIKYNSLEVDKEFDFIPVFSDEDIKVLLQTGYDQKNLSDVLVQNVEKIKNGKLKHEEFTKMISVISRFNSLEELNDGLKTDIKEFAKIPAFVEAAKSITNLWKFKTSLIDTGREGTDCFQNGICELLEDMYGNFDAFKRMKFESDMTKREIMTAQTVLAKLQISARTDAKVFAERGGRTSMITADCVNVFGVLTHSDEVAVEDSRNWLYLFLRKINSLYYTASKDSYHFIDTMHFTVNLGSEKDQNVKDAYINIADIAMFTFDRKAVKSLDSKNFDSFIRARINAFDGMRRYIVDRVFDKSIDLHSFSYFGNEGLVKDHEDRVKLNLGWNEIEEIPQQLLSDARIIHEILDDDAFAQFLFERLKYMYYTSTVKFVTDYTKIKLKDSNVIPRSLVKAAYLKHCFTMETFFKKVAANEISINQIKSFILDMYLSSAASSVLSGCMIRLGSEYQEQCKNPNIAKTPSVDTGGMYGHFINSMIGIQALLDIVDEKNIGTDLSKNREYGEKQIPDNIKNLFGVDGALMLLGDAFHPAPESGMSNLFRMKSKIQNESIEFVGILYRMLVPYLLSVCESYESSGARHPVLHKS